MIPVDSNYNKSNAITLLLQLLLAIHITTRCTKTTDANKFDPYSMNGGLVSAIAGPDYVIIASDTRLSEGYEILSRDHLTSRIWSAVPNVAYSSININGNNNDGNNSDTNDSMDTAASVAISRDGSLGLFLTLQSKEDKYTIHHPISPTFIASAGCSSDCEALKRQIRLEINSHIHWNHGLDTLSPTGIANLLGQTLYSRRGFPFYSFCILAGLSNSSNSHGLNHGVVHIYDAIGSHERVAVATAGTGKEMLQPILDRLFSVATNDDDNDGKKRLLRDGNAVMASKQRVGLKLQPPVQTFVSCSSEEAVSLLVRGYKSVAEREIAVGDNVVVCVIRKQKHTTKNCQQHEHDTVQDNTCDSTLQVLRFQLKSH